SRRMEQNLRGHPRRNIWSGEHGGEELAEAMRLDLSPRQRQLIEKRPTESVEAYADYAQAKSFLERPDIAGNVERATRLLEAATEKDPKFAEAHATLGEAYLKRYAATHD